MGKKHLTKIFTNNKNILGGKNTIYLLNSLQITATNFTDKN